MQLVGRLCAIRNPWPVHEIEGSLWFSVLSVINNMITDEAQEVAMTIANEIRSPQEHGGMRGSAWDVELLLRVPDPQTLEIYDGCEEYITTNVTWPSSGRLKIPGLLQVPLEVHYPSSHAFSRHNRRRRTERNFSFTKCGRAKLQVGTRK